MYIYMHGKHHHPAFRYYHRASEPMSFEFCARHYNYFVHDVYSGISNINFMNPLLMGLLVLCISKMSKTNLIMSDI